MSTAQSALESQDFVDSFRAIGAPFREMRTSLITTE